MSTNSTIALRRNGEILKKVYCHWDGYLERNGDVLFNYYNDEDRVIKLLELGDLSSLKQHISPEEVGLRAEAHSYEHPVEDVCVAYCRDRGESLDFLTPDVFLEYNYIYDADDKTWYVSYGDSDERRLEDELEEHCW